MLCRKPHFIGLHWLALEERDTGESCFKNPQKWPIPLLIKMAMKIHPTSTNVYVAEVIQQGMDA